MVTALVHARTPSPSDVTDDEWARIAPYVPPAKPGGRPEEHPKREILDGICYVLRGGCAWRMLPHNFPPWQSGSHDCRAGPHDGTWEVIHDRLRGDGCGGTLREDSIVWTSPPGEEVVLMGFAGAVDCKRSRESDMAGAACCCCVAVGFFSGNVRTHGGRLSGLVSG